MSEFAYAPVSGARNFIEVDYSRLIAFSAALSAAPDIAREELAAAMTQVVELLTKQVSAFASKDQGIGASGNLANSITNTQQLTDTGVIGAVFSSLNYAEPVELGTRPHFPPIEPLIDWVIQKLGVPEKEAKSVAFLVARKISVKGTEAQPIFSRSLVEQQTAQEGAFIAAGERMAARIGAAR